MSIESVLGKVPVNANVRVMGGRRKPSQRNLNGLYVNVEGIDGSGKTELVEALELRAFLNSQAVSEPPVTVRQPGGSEYSEAVRDICRKAKVDNFTQTLVYGSALYNTYSTVIMPALTEGKTVIADRGYNTLFAYQGLFGRCSSLIIAMLREIHNYRAADLTVYLSLPLEVSLQRTGANRPDQEDDRFAQQKLEEKRLLKAYYDLLHGLKAEAKDGMTTEQFQWATIAISNYRCLDHRIRWDMPFPQPVIIDATQPRAKVLEQTKDAIVEFRKNQE